MEKAESGGCVVAGVCVVPMELRVDEEEPLGTLLDCLGRLDAAGFDEVFVD